MLLFCALYRLCWSSVALPQVQKVFCKIFEEFYYTVHQYFVSTQYVLYTQLRAPGQKRYIFAHVKFPLVLDKRDIFAHAKFYHTVGQVCETGPCMYEAALQEGG